MKIINESLIASPIDMAIDFVLPPIYLGNIINYSIQLLFTGSPAGALKLQCSNDAPKNTPGSQTESIINWTDIAGSTQTITSAGNHTWDVQNCGYMWVRPVYIAASGTGVLTKARLTVKGI